MSESGWRVGHKGIMREYVHTRGRSANICVSRTELLHQIHLLSQPLIFAFFVTTSSGENTGLRSCVRNKETKRSISGCLKLAISEGISGHL